MDAIEIAVKGMILRTLSNSCQEAVSKLANLRTLKPQNLVMVDLLLHQNYILDKI